MRYLFIGSSDYGLPALNKLRQNGYEPSLIISQPAKPAGRNLHLTPTPVSQYAIEQKLPLFTPVDINSAESIAKMAEQKAEIIVTAAFGEFINKKIRNLCPFGAVNLHPSLLPKYRGASPIQSALLNGETETGTTISLVSAKMDAGPILAQTKLSIAENETYSELKERLAEQAGDLLLQFWKKLIMEKSLCVTKQDESKATYCYKITNKTCQIDWNKRTEEIHNQIRAFSLTPGAWTLFRNNKLKILCSEKTEEPANGEPGLICKIEKKRGFFVNCLDFKLLITKVQPAGKKVMEAVAFINGARLREKEKLGGEK